MEIAVINNQHLARVRIAALRQLTAFFLNKAGRRHAGNGWGEVSVVLVDDSGSQAVNAAYLHHDYPTDVISFNLDAVPGEASSAPCGEVVINVQQALRLGPRFGGAARELALYLAHGCDHLSGADDDTSARRRRMRRRELRWLAEARRAGLERLLP